jgi:hypothetical protein
MVSVCFLFLFFFFSLRVAFPDSNRLPPHLLKNPKMTVDQVYKSFSDKHPSSSSLSSVSSSHTQSASSSNTTSHSAHSTNPNNDRPWNFLTGVETEPEKPEANAEVKDAPVCGSSPFQ